MDKRSHIFNDTEELLEFINREVMKYTGCTQSDKILFSYNRMTVEEIAQEVVLKILRSHNDEGINKSYVRQAVVYVCIDIYRKTSDICPGISRFSNHLSNGVTYTSTAGEGIPLPSQLANEVPEYELIERLLNLKMFEPKELEVIILLMEGKRNPEIRQELNIPKMSYYTLLNRIKSKYSGTTE